jgi:hypothetical protein
MCGGGFFLPPETLTTKHGPILGGTKRKRRLFSATRTDGNGFLFIKLIWRSLGWGPFLLADLAPFGQVFKLLVVEENLFPGGEHKILAAIYTLQYLVLEFHGIPFQPKIHNIATARVWRDFPTLKGQPTCNGGMAG